MIDLNNTDRVCVDFYENHVSYVTQNRLDNLTPQTQRIYLRGEEIINNLLNDQITF